MRFHATASLTVPEPEAMLEALVSDVSARGLAPASQSADRVLFRFEVGAIGIAAEGEALAFTAQARAEVALHRLKQLVIERLDEVAPGEALRLRWSDDADRPQEALPAFFHRMTLAGRREILPGLWRLTFTVEDMPRLGSDGIHVKLLLPPQGSKTPRSETPQWPRLAANGALVLPEGDAALTLRYYTIRTLRPEAGEIDIDVVRHAGGSFADWAKTAPLGAVIGLLGPSGGQDLPLSAPATSEVSSEGASRTGLLLIGDATAAPAIARMIEARAGTPPAPEAAAPGGHVILGLGDDALARSYLDEVAVAVLGLTVHGLAAGRFDAEAEALARELTAAAPPAFAWFAGERDTAQRLRGLFRQQFGLGKGEQMAIAYWTRGKAAADRA